MKTAEEIFEDALKFDEIPKGYDQIIEICCFEALKRLLLQFRNNHITKELATSEKMKIFRIYNQNKKLYEFYLSIYFEKYKNKISEERKMLHNKLQEKMNSKNSSVEECFLIALELLEMCEERFE